MFQDNGLCNYYQPDSLGKIILTLAFGFLIAKLHDLHKNLFLKIYEEGMKNFIPVCLLNVIYILNCAFVSLLLTMLKPELV